MFVPFKEFFAEFPSADADAFVLPCPADNVLAKFSVADVPAAC